MTVTVQYVDLSNTHPTYTVFGVTTNFEDLVRGQDYEVFAPNTVVLYFGEMTNDYLK